MEKRILAIRRDDRYSPNSEENDRAILQSVIDRLGTGVMMIDEVDFTTDDDADVYLSLGRMAATVSLLKHKEDNGALVINSGYGVEACTRSRLEKTMRQYHIPMPAMTDDAGFWLKRGDETAQNKNDVVYCKDETALTKAKAEFRRRGIIDMVVSAHVRGDLIKFYGVVGGFFRYFYPCDDHQSKFGDELVNGEAHHYKFDLGHLQQTVARLAKIVRIDIYGGDAIVEANGNINIIDFNDWPSFSRCREEAADAIARYINEK